MFDKCNARKITAYTCKPMDIFWSITWVYDQTRTGKRNIQNIIYATVGCIVFIGYFLLKLINE